MLAAFLRPRGEARVALAPAPRLFGKAAFDLGEGQSFEDTEPALAQASIGTCLEPRFDRDGARGVVGARGSLV